MEILGRVRQTLPFEIMTSKENREDLRLKYRYLDLRNRKVKDNIIFRSQVIRFPASEDDGDGLSWRSRRRYLCASSPEGGQRLHRALPQT